MLQNTTESSLPPSRSHSRYDISSDISEHYHGVQPLTSQLNTVTNTNENLILEGIPPDDNKKHSSTTNTGWLKRFIIGSCIITGTGLLGLSRNFSSGDRKESSSSLVDNKQQANILPKLEIPYFSLQDKSPETYRHQVLPDTTEIPIKNSTSENDMPEPYSYYKEIYGKKITTISLAQAESSTEKNSLSQTLSDREMAPLLSTKTPVTKSARLITPDKARDFFYKSLPASIYHRQKNTIYLAMQEFYRLEINNVMILSDEIEKNGRCIFIADLLDRISKYRTEERVITQSMSHKRVLTQCSRAQTVLAKRKVAALISAVEVLIHNQVTTQYQDKIINNEIRYYDGDIETRVINIIKVLKYMTDNNVCHPVQTSTEPLTGHGAEKINCSIR